MLLSKITSMFRMDRLTDWLPYLAYDEERELYVNADGTFGFMQEIAPVMFAGEHLLNGLTSVLEQEWPKDALIQIILYADPNMTGMIDRYSSIRNQLLDVSDPRQAFLHEWCGWQAGYLRQHCRGGISTDVPVPFRNFRCFLTVKVPCSIRDIQGDSTQAADRLAVVRDNLLGMFRSNQIRTQNTRPESLIQILWQLWNPGHGFLDRNLWDQRRPIREQVIAPDTEITRCRAGVLVDGYRVAVKTPQVYPLSITSVKANLLIGDLFGSNLQQICSPFALTLQIDPMPADNSLNFKAEITGMQHTAFKALAPRIARKNDEFCWAASQQEQGTKFLRGYLTLVMYDNQPCTDADPGNYSRNESMAANVWENQGFRLQNELFAGLEFMMAAMPFGLYRPALKNMKRFVSAPAGTFALLAPIQGDWRGTENEAMLFLTRRGQLCSLDFFDSDTNYNFAIAAPSGSGKSFLTNKILQDHASRGGIAYVIDIGKSYKKLCQMQLGQYIEFEEGKNISVNVFSELSAELFALDEAENNAEPDARAKHQEERATLLTMYTQLLSVMAFPREVCPDLEQAILSNVILEGYAQLPPNEIMEVDRFVEILDAKQTENDRNGKQDHIFGHLAERLRKYCRAGEYGKWFHGKANVNFERPFVVLELEQLNSMKDLREVVLLLLISIIERKFYFGDRKILKLLLCDEAWDLFENPNSASFIGTAYRRIRKYYGAIGTIVQSFLDFSRKGNVQVGQAILSNSEWKLALEPKIEELKECIDQHLLNLNEAQMYIAGTVRTTKGFYSEVLLLSSKQSTVFRFIPTELEKVAYTTSPVEMQMYEDIQTALEKRAGGESPEPLRVLSLSCYANALLAQGYSPQDAERLALEREDEALAYANRQFRAA